MELLLRDLARSNYCRNLVNLSSISIFQIPVVLTPVALLMVSIVQFIALHHRQITVSYLTFLSIFPANRLL